MRNTQRLAWSAAATLLCGTGVLAASGLLGTSLRPSFFEAAQPSNPFVLEETRPAAVKAEAPARPAPANEPDIQPEAASAPVLWLRPAMSQEDFEARFEAATPALAFAAAAPMPFGEAETVATETSAAPASAPSFLDVRPPVRPRSIGRKLASLDPDGALLTDGDPAPAAVVPDDAAAPPVGGSKLFQSWSDPFGRGTNAAAPPVGRSLQAGMASWYGPGFHGRRTASGEVFNQNAMTAAHRYLPFGTKVKVVDERTGRAIVVRINDRGPFKHGRVIDLSRVAAQQLGIGGLARVKLVSADE